ncbi:hypothetical protein HanXRQr2_Chr12g0555031 [Helianthus annuus]|uniref:Uncharacterized protein n=1 Tax=Helianthus annuus TaxID=4232 RepID=A0A9K3HIP2_HELAN|nr:hypothetical protein HanXRQr2_Chr12g0555031 [Helianthus annuus]KAJ0863813.1 hypothetical protein HanPSC8_Chr12g0534401 [Helianthus annuus]
MEKTDGPWLRPPVQGSDRRTETPIFLFLRSFDRHHPPQRRRLWWWCCCCSPPPPEDGGGWPINRGGKSKGCLVRRTEPPSVGVHYRCRLRCDWPESGHLSSPARERGEL